MIVLKISTTLKAEEYEEYSIINRTFIKGLNQRRQSAGKEKKERKMGGRGGGVQTGEIQITCVVSIPEDCI